MNKKAIRDLIIVILLLVAFPVVLRGGGKIFGIVVAAMIVAATLVMLPFCVTLGLLFAGGIQVVSGFSAMSKGLPNGMSTLGFGVLLFAGGILTLILSVIFYKKSIPWVIRKLKVGSDKKQEIKEENKE